MAKKSIANKLCKTVVALAYKVSTNEANSTCSFWSYQPKEPEAVKKLRKF